ncbi:MAG: hypothetical protein IT449_02655 [Phycisphaerales bacterium]|nr:hypothetical protein [Phycisphaerales bacterium]
MDIFQSNIYLCWYSSMGPLDGLSRSNDHRVASLESQIEALLQNSRLPPHRQRLRRVSGVRHGGQTMNLARRKIELSTWLAAVATTIVCVFPTGGRPVSREDLLFGLFVVAPYLIIPIAISLIYFRPAQLRPPFRQAAVLAIVTCGFSVLAYVEAAFFPTSSTAGLIFLFMPIWMLLGSLVLVPLLLGRPSPEKVRGNCQTCGYDLTGNVSGKCPECGEVAGGRQTRSDHVA